MGRIDHTDPGPGEGLPGKCSRETLAALPINPSSPRGQTGAKAPHPVSVLPSSIMQEMGWADWEGNLSLGGTPRQRVL